MFIFTTYIYQSSHHTQKLTISSRPCNHANRHLVILSQFLLLFVILFLHFHFSIDIPLQTFNCSSFLHKFLFFELLFVFMSLLFSFSPFSQSCSFSPTSRAISATVTSLQLFEPSNSFHSPIWTLHILQSLPLDFNPLILHCMKLPFFPFTSTPSFPFFYSRIHY